MRDKLFLSLVSSKLQRYVCEKYSRSIALSNDSQWYFGLSASYVWHFCVSQHISVPLHVPNNIWVSVHHYPFLYFLSLSCNTLVHHYKTQTNPLPPTLGRYFCTQYIYVYIRCYTRSNNLFYI